MFKVYTAYWSLLVVVFPGVAFGDANIAAQMAQMTESTMLNSCDDSAFLGCVGAKVPACKAAVNTAIGQCRSKFPKQISQSDMQNDPDKVMGEWSDCVTEKIQAALKISDELMAKCDTQSGGSEDDSQALAPPDMSPEQYKADLDKFAKQMAAGIQSHARLVGTSDVTLPIYKNSTVIARIEGSQLAQLYGIPTALTTVSFASPDSPDTVTSFYKNSLKGFRQHKLSKGVVFAEGNVAQTDGNDLDILRKLIAYPYVMIAPVEGDNAVLAGSKSTITIGIKK